jgi:hypothetical protein
MASFTADAVWDAFNLKLFEAHPRARRHLPNGTDSRGLHRSGKGQGVTGAAEAGLGEVPRNMRS